MLTALSLLLAHFMFCLLLLHLRFISNYFYLSPYFMPAACLSPFLLLFSLFWSSLTRSPHCFFSLHFTFTHLFCLSSLFSFIIAPPPLLCFTIFDLLSTPRHSFGCSLFLNFYFLYFDLTLSVDPTVSFLFILHPLVFNSFCVLLLCCFYL